MADFFRLIFTSSSSSRKNSRKASEEKGRRTLRGGRSWKKQNLEGYVRNIGLHPEFSGTPLEGFKAGV